MFRDERRQFKVASADFSPAIELVGHGPEQLPSGRVTYDAELTEASGSLVEVIFSKHASIRMPVKMRMVRLEVMGPASALEEGMAVVGVVLTYKLSVKVVERQEYWLTLSIEFDNNSSEV